MADDDSEYLNYGERKALIKHLCTSKLLSFKDKNAINWAAFRFEVALLLHVSANRQIEKYGSRLNNFIDIYRFNEELEELK